MAPPHIESQIKIRENGSSLESFFQRVGLLPLLPWNVGHGYRGLFQRSNLEPWQGQSQVNSAGFQVSRQPIWGHLMTPGPNPFVSPFADSAMWTASLGAEGRRRKREGEYRDS